MSSCVSMGTLRELEKTGRAGHAFPPKPMGEIFWVDHFAGNNNYDGQNKTRPLRTITEALARCVNDRNDVILVKDCWDQEPGVINVNKTRVHIIGMALPTNPYPTLQAIGDNPVFRLTGDGNICEIAGLALGGGSTSPCIELNNNMGSWFHDIWFGWRGANQTPQDGIRNDAGFHNYQSLRVERCRFFGSLGAAIGTISRYGIYFPAAASNLGHDAEFINNRFHCLDTAIRLTNGSDQVIEHNYIMCPSDDVVGRGIYINGGVGCIIANNKAGDNGIADMAFNPYYDVLGTLNAWLCNQNGHSYVFPAIEQL